MTLIPTPEGSRHRSYKHKVIYFLDLEAVTVLGVGYSMLFLVGVDIVVFVPTANARAFRCNFISKAHQRYRRGSNPFNLCNTYAFERCEILTIFGKIT